MERWPGQIEGCCRHHRGRAHPGGIDAKLAHLAGQDAMIGVKGDIAADDIGCGLLDSQYDRSEVLGIIGMALVGFRGDGERAQATSASIKEPSKAFPRLRVL